MTNSPLKSHTFLAFLTVLAAYVSGVVAHHVAGLVIPPEMIVSLAGTFVFYALARQYKSAKLAAIALELKKELVDGQLDDNPLAPAVVAAIEAAVQKALKPPAPPPAPAEKPAPSPAVGAAGTTLALLLFVGGTALMATSCKHASPTGQAALDCLKPAVVSACQLAADDVAKALSGSDVAWANDMESLAAHYGLGVVLCEVKVLVAAWLTPSNGPSSSVAAYYMATPTRLVRAQAWLAAHGQ